MIRTIKIATLGIVFLAVATLTNCQKYQDGPLISLRSKTERVSNTWKVDNYKKNGNDLTSIMTGYNETFSSDGSYSYTQNGADGTGKWVFQNNTSEVRINGITSQSSVTLVILKLEEKQFWYYYMDGSDKKEFHMVEK